MFGNKSNFISTPTFFISLLLLLVTTTMSANLFADPRIDQPAADSTLSGSSQTFSWSLSDIEVDQWWLYVGTSVGAKDIANSGDLGLNTTYDVIGIPQDGSTVYARLWYFQEDRWRYVDSTYTAATNEDVITTPAMTTPANNSELAGASATFEWSDNNTPVNFWWLYIGSRQGGRDLYDSDTAIRAQTSVTIDQLPVDGSIAYVRLWFRTNEDGWQYSDTQYRTGNGSTDSGDDGSSDDGGTDGGSELAAITDFEYSGAFRLKNGEFGNSSLDYAVGTLAVNPSKQSLFIAGHEQHRSVAEYPIVQAGMQTEVAGLPETGAPLQNFVDLLDPLPNPQSINRITGMYWLDGSLIVNAENWYDAGGRGTDTTVIVPNADNLNAGAKGFFQLQGAAHAAGYMGPIPEQWQSAFGAQHYTGWSSVYSIISRYSIGPSLWTFDPSALINADPTTNPAAQTQPKLNYPYGGPGAITHLSERALEWAEQGTDGPFPPSDALWNPLSAGRYGFFVPGTKTFAVVGHTAGLQSGIGYKAVQSDGNVCPGPCPYDPADYSNYYWFYNVEDILSASELYQPKPYAYGSFDVPFDAEGKRPIIGATFDTTTKTLYLAVRNAAQLGTYDRPPLIVTYKLK